MPSLFDWSSTAASNTTLDSINVNTGMSVGNTDNAIRSLMAVIRATFSSTLQTFLAGSAPLSVANGGTGLTTSIVPAGAVFYFAMSTAPSGYLDADGSAVSRATYAALFANIGTTYGSGDGSTTFNLPDLRGEFVRGFDDGRGVDTGRVFGSAQADEIKAHTHGPPSGATEILVAKSGGTFSGGGGATLAGAAATGSTGGTETRPRNVALLACIKI